MAPAAVLSETANEMMPSDTDVILTSAPTTCSTSVSKG